MGDEVDREEVARRVRRAVGFKVMRDLHREARAMELERRRRPQLVLALLGVIALVAIAGVWAVYTFLR